MTTSGAERCRMSKVVQFPSGKYLLILEYMELISQNIFFSSISRLVTAATHRFLLCQQILLNLRCLEKGPIEDITVKWIFLEVHSESDTKFDQQLINIVSPTSTPPPSCLIRKGENFECVCCMYFTKDELLLNLDPT